MSVSIFVFSVVGKEIDSLLMAMAMCSVSCNSLEQDSNPKIGISKQNNFFIFL